MAAFDSSNVSLPFCSAETACESVTVSYWVVLCRLKLADGMLAELVG